jgi:hypothetical protein
VSITWLLTAMTLSSAGFAAYTSLAQSFDDLGGFQTPSGNIHCAAYKDLRAGRAELRCDLVQNTARIPARPADCELEWGDAFGMNNRGEAERICHGDTVQNPKNPVLQYTKVWSAGGFRCDVTQARLRCVNTDRHGWELSRSKQTIF